MLVIRNLQMAALADGVLNGVAARVSAALLADAEQQQAGVPPQACLRRVAWAVQRARTHGFTHYGSMIVFAACLLEFGPAFERHPTVARLLASTASVADARLDRLLDGLPKYMWSELDMIRNDTDWHDIDRATLRGGSGV